MENRKMIYLDDAIDALERIRQIGYEHNASVLSIRQAILDLPPAQPEIIRCEDCIYYRWEIDMCDEPYSTARNVVHEDDYCSKAERRKKMSDPNRKVIHLDDAIDAVSKACYELRGVFGDCEDALLALPSAQSQYEELTPEEAASEIASGSTMSAWYWLDDMVRLKQMGYAICRKR